MESESELKARWQDEEDAILATYDSAHAAMIKAEQAIFAACTECPAFFKMSDFIDYLKASESESDWQLIIDYRKAVHAALEFTK